MNKIFIFLFVFLAISSTSSAESNFAKIKLPRGIEIQLPKGWWLLGKDLQKIIDTSVESAMDLSGLDSSAGTETNLIKANSMPKTMYAAVSVDSTIPVSIPPSNFNAITKNDIHEIEKEMRDGLKNLLTQQGMKLIEFKGTKYERMSGYPALITTYRRSGLKGTVLVQINQIITETQEIRINLSYRESESIVWKPIIGKMRKSILIVPWKL